jgi:creatinine amidohydrolase
LEVVMRFSELTYREVALAAERGAVALVPFGCTEQQGPHLAVGFDTWFAETLAERASDRAKERFDVDSVVLPVMPFGPTPEHRNFGSGFIDLPHAVHDAVLEAVVDSLANQGFESILIWRGCGGHDLVDAVERCNRRWRDQATVTLPAHPFHEIWCRLGDPDVPGGHADSFATSIALHLRAEQVRQDLVPEPSETPDWNSARLDFTDYSTSGVIGDARFASAELGAQLLEACVEAVAETIRDARLYPDRVGVDRLPTAGGPRDSNAR